MSRRRSAPAMPSLAAASAIRRSSSGRTAFRSNRSPCSAAAPSRRSLSAPIPDQDIKGLKGKTVAVMSYQDTTYYSLLGTLANFGMTKADVKAQAVGPGGVVQLVVSGTAPALAGVPEWGVAVETAGVPVEWFPTREFFPGMAQAILASDATIAKRPKMVRGFVHATLKALADIIADPAAATEAYVAAVPQNADKKDQMGKVIGQYAKLVYAGQNKLGEMIPLSSPSCRSSISRSRSSAVRPRSGAVHQ